MKSCIRYMKVRRRSADPKDPIKSNCYWFVCLSINFLNSDLHQFQSLEKSAAGFRYYSMEFSKAELFLKLGIGGITKTVFRNKALWGSKNLLPLIYAIYFCNTRLTFNPTGGLRPHKRKVVEKKFDPHRYFN